MIREIPVERSRLVLGFLVVTALITLTSDVHARKDDLMLTERGKNEMRKVAEELVSSANALGETYGTEAALLFREISIGIERGGYEASRNLVYWLLRDDADDMAEYISWMERTEIVEEVRVVVVSMGDGDSLDWGSFSEHKLDDRYIRVENGADENRRAKVTVSFPSLKKGDLQFISIRTKGKEFNWWDLRLYSTLPTARAQVRVRMPKGMKFQAFGRQFSDAEMRRLILRGSKESPEEFVLRVDDLPPIASEPYAPPSRLRTPSFLVVRPERVAYWSEHIKAADIPRTQKGLDRLWNPKTWEHVALDIDKWRTWLAAGEDQLRHLCIEMARGRPSSLELADEFYRFISDQFTHGNVWGFKDDKGRTTFDVMIREEMGDEIDRALLLERMLELLDFEVSILWARDPLKGPLVREFPKLFQVQNPIVRARWQGEERFYDMNCMSCPASVVRSYMSNAEAFEFANGTRRAASALYSELRAKHTRDTFTVALLYGKEIKNQNWSKETILPAFESAGLHWTREVVEFVSASTREATYSLWAAGLTNERWRLRRADSPEETFLEILQERRPDVEFANPQLQAYTDSILGSASGSSEFVSSVEGATWQLAPEAVYGNESLEEWITPRRTNFYSDEARRHEWICSIPLPEGWSGVELPQPRRFSSSGLEYEWACSVESGVLIVRRSLMVPRIDSDDKALISELGDQFAAIRALEAKHIDLDRSIP